MRSRLAKLAAEAKKIKVAPATARVGAGKNVKLDTQYRILESPGCRRVVLAGPEGRVDARTAESLLWKVCRSIMMRGDARRVPTARARPLTLYISPLKYRTAAIMGDQLPYSGTV